MDSEIPVSEDFDDRVDIIPVSDPNAGTMAQRIMQYQAALQLSAQAPQMYDLPLLHRQMLEVLNIRDADKIVPTEDDIAPTDPVSENMDIINGKPVKAYYYQDHEAHIQVHMSALQDPKIQELLSQAPDAGKIQAAFAAHVQQHLAFLYRQQIEKELGTKLPLPGEKLPEDIEYRISELVAPAAAQLLGKNMQEQQMQQNQQMQEDPVIQMQQRELQIKEMEAQSKAMIEQARLQLEAQKAMMKSQLDQQKADQDMEIEQAKLAVRIAEDNEREQLETKRIASKEQIEGAKLGVEIAKDVFKDE
tara:strand:+ start:51 stop:962 length:912 start_codon:yes stop_codon:yes gene_type:complete